MWQCKKCCTENEDQLSYCKNCGMSKAKSLRQPRLNKKKNKKKPIKEIIYTIMYGIIFTIGLYADFTIVTWLGGFAFGISSIFLLDRLLKNVSLFSSDLVIGVLVIVFISIFLSAMFKACNSSISDNEEIYQYHNKKTGEGQKEYGGSIEQQRDLEMIDEYSKTHPDF